MRKTLLVFDIDGTLIRTKAGRVAFNRAFEKVFGRPEAAATVEMAGRTDPAIYRDVCTLHGIDPSTFGAWKLEFLSALAVSLQVHPAEAMPGIPVLVDHCRREPGFTLALGTGNLEEGARLKLASTGLNEYFATGGFGTDGETRADVIAAAIARAGSFGGHSADRVIVIGDTPQDVACGKANGAQTVAVATGPFSVDQLAACRPDVVLADLSQTTIVLEYLRTL